MHAYQWCMTCVNSVLCLHSLHSPPSGFSNEVGLGPIFDFTFGLLVTFIFCRTTNRKLNLSGFTLMTYVGYMTIHNSHISQLWTFLSYIRVPPGPMLPGWREVLLYMHTYGLLHFFWNAISRKHISKSLSSWYGFHLYYSLSLEENENMKKKGSGYTGQSLKVGQPWIANWADSAYK